MTYLSLCIFHVFLVDKKVVVVTNTLYKKGVSMQEKDIKRIMVKQFKKRTVVFEMNNHKCKKF